MSLKNLLIGAALLIALGTSTSYASTLRSGEFVVGPTNPGKWGSPVMGTGATVSWSLMPNFGDYVALSNFMPVGFEAAIQAAFNAWSAVANINFVQVADLGEPFDAVTQLSGDIRLGGHVFDGSGGVLAHGFFPPANGNSGAGDIHFDTAETWKLAFGGSGFDIFQVAAHEIGHAIGLDHTSVAASLMNPFYTEAFSGPQADDIAGAQFIYGAPVVNPPTVPLPAALPLLALGLAGLGVFGYSRRKETVDA